jgi:NADPH2 dehydrogenase
VRGIPWSQPGFLAPLAARIGAETGALTATSWTIREPEHADELVRSRQVDLVMLARATLENPHWPYEAAKKLGRPKPQDTLPVQYAVWLKGR